MNLKSLYAACLLVLLALLSGCASVPMASDAEDAQAKTYAVKPGKANIYVFRNEVLGSAITLSVSLNGPIQGKLASKTYIVFEVNPGKHVVGSHTENVEMLTVDAVAGRNYFVWQEIKMGMMSPRSILHLVDDATGRKGVEECKRIQPDPKT